MAEAMRCLTSQRASVIARPWHDSEWHHANDAGPVLPTRQLRQIIRPHEPYEGHPREELSQRAQGVERVALAEFRFDRGRHDAAPIGDPPCAGQAVGQAGHAGARFERVTGRDQQPDLVEPQPPPGERGDMQMSGMRRVERTAEQADPHPPLVAPSRDPVGDEGRALKRAIFQGRTWPVPRMT